MPFTNRTFASVFGGEANTRIRRIREIAAELDRRADVEIKYGRLQAAEWASTRALELREFAECRG